MRIFNLLLCVFVIHQSVAAQTREVKQSDNWENYVEVIKFFDEDFKKVDRTEAEYYCREMREQNNLTKGVRLIYRLDSTLYAVKCYSNLEDNQLHGTVQYYNKNEVLTGVKTFVMGKLDGPFRRYYDDGAIKSEGEYKGDDYHIIDTLKTFYPSGKLRRLDYYDPKSFLLVEGKCFAHDGSDTTYFPYLHEASFVGGPLALQKWISENVVYPEAALDLGEQGRVYVTFVVETDGSISNVTVQKGVSGELDKEAVRLVKSMPNWLPGGTDGFSERTRCQIPISFILAGRTKKRKRR